MWFATIFDIAVPPTSAAAASRRLCFSKEFGQSLNVETSSAAISSHRDEDIISQMDDGMMEISSPSRNYPHADQAQGISFIAIIEEYVDVSISKIYSIDLVFLDAKYFHLQN
jgi:hypothetical protein